MGTFHQGKGELHGITVVVDTPGATAYIGRCDTVTDEGAYLLDVDVYEAQPGDPSKEAWIRRASKVGQWKKHDQVFVPRDQIASIQRLADVRTG